MSEMRSKLFGRIEGYIQSAADPVRQHLEHGHVHNTPEFLPWHRGFLRGFEDWQRAEALELNDEFIPLAYRWSEHPARHNYSI